MSRNRSLVAAVGAAAAVSILLFLGRSGADTPRPHPIEVTRLEAFHPPVGTTVRPGDTLESVARRLAPDDWPAWRDALANEIDPRALPPGTRFSGRTTPRGVLENLIASLDLRTEVHLVRTGDTIETETVRKPVQSRIVRFEGSIESSLFGAIASVGAHPELAVRMAEIFQWDVDFLRDIRKGDSFVALVEENSVDGAFYGYGTLFAARFVNDGRRLEAIAYAGPDGRVGYYDLDGAPLEKQFLRSPLKFSRITSSFSLNRFHPVLKRSMPHYGVDYGAPVGTPAHVTAAGTVTFVGRNGGAGNMVRVRHANGYETNYLHLSRFARGIRKGVHVDQGQVIGYVGQTGWATGPHLDYRVKLNGHWINPLRIASPPADPLPESVLERFSAHALAVLELLEGHQAPPGARC